MAQTGYTPILIYGSTAPGNAPSAGNLTTSANGVELAINAADGKLYYKDNLGAVQLLASKAGASGSVTSVDVSGGTTGLTTSGGPVTTSGTITIAGTLAVSNGGTGAVTLTGLVKGNGTSAFTAAVAGTDYVTPAGTESLSNKTLVSPTITGTATVVNMTSSGYAAMAIGTLTDGATITPDFGVGNNFSVTLAGNRTLANPTNLVAGQSGVIFISQDATGSRTLAFGSYWDFPNQTAPTLTTTANAVDMLVFTVRNSTSIGAALITDIG